MSLIGACPRLGFRGGRYDFGAHRNNTRTSKWPKNSSIFSELFHRRGPADNVRVCGKPTMKMSIEYDLSEIQNGVHLGERR